MGLFIDTNILVYAHDQDAGARHEVASKLVKRLWQTHPLPSISAQVLQELYVNLLRKRSKPDETLRVVKNYGAWSFIATDFLLVSEAIVASQRWRISLWDALIVEAARRAGATELWTEDLNAGQDFAGVLVVNPLV